MEPEYSSEVRKGPFLNSAISHINPVNCLTLHSLSLLLLFTHLLLVLPNDLSPSDILATNLYSKNRIERRNGVQNYCFVFGGTWVQI
jgi:hypothetical protein